MDRRGEPYCESCGKAFTTVDGYEGLAVAYRCRCGHAGKMTLADSAAISESWSACARRPGRSTTAAAGPQLPTLLLSVDRVRRLLAGPADPVK
jgi:hypothetical protein